MEPENSIGKTEKRIEIGDFVIVQRQNYTKLAKIKVGGTLVLGKDIIELENIVGRRFYETFRMVLKPGSKRLYELEEVEELTTSNQLNIERSGEDNRHIVDDCSSQTLTKIQIEELRDQATSSSAIVGKLIANSKTFNSKTEYSQKKYLKKKEKKYFEYVQVRKPTIRLLTQMFYRQDPTKLLGIRIDDLSQILAYANIHSEGNCLLYDSGTSGLLPAAILSTIGAYTIGSLIHAHPGNECQKNAFIAMQFPREQLERCIHVNLYSVLRCFYQQENGKDEEQEKQEESSSKKLDGAEINSNPEQNVANELGECSSTTFDLKQDSHENKLRNETNLVGGSERENGETSNTRKRKLSETISERPTKKPCWQIHNEKACELLKNKIDSVIVVAKEHPVHIVKELIPFLKPSRSLVVFNLLKEPLQDLYYYLKSRTDFVGIKLSNNFMRSYQVLPERTHPEISMNFGGYILSGFKLKS